MGSYVGEVSPTGKLKVKRIRTWRTRRRLAREWFSRMFNRKGK